MRKKSIKSLKKEADRFFSEYIRKSHADVGGYVRCVTCGNRHHWEEIQCGHFVSRVYLATRYDKDNCAPQCYACNVLRRGNPAEFARYIIEKEGASMITILCETKRVITKYSRADYENIIGKYRMKIEQLGKSNSRSERIEK